jgi:hypothetical protein
LGRLRASSSHERNEEELMHKLLIGLVGAAVLGTGGYAAAAGLDDAQPARTVSISDSTTTGTTTDDTTTTSRTTAAQTVPDDIVVGNAPTGTGANVDISGPCDEAEHANDPRCTGGAAADDDRSGSNSGSDDDDDDRGGDDDRSGSNSGSGHGGHDNDDNDDNDD